VLSFSEGGSLASTLFNSASSTECFIHTEFFTTEKEHVVAKFEHSPEKCVEREEVPFETRTNVHPTLALFREVSFSTKIKQPLKLLVDLFK
jgi:hypothetical protein